MHLLRLMLSLQDTVDLHPRSHPHQNLPRAVVSLRSFTCQLLALQETRVQIVAP
jgi:hypothetical protein